MLSALFQSSLWESHNNHYCKVSVCNIQQPCAEHSSGYGTVAANARPQVQMETKENRFPELV